MGQKLVVTDGHVDLLSSVVGYSRWTLTDLHVHTPVDFNHHYGDVGGPQPNAAFATSLIKAHADAGVTVMAVTDHNTIAWYPVLAEAGRSYGVTVFPGVEVNINKCHLMAIWDCTPDGYQRGQQFLSSLFPPSGPPALTDRRQPNPVTNGSPLDIVKTAADDFGALVLAPHSTAKTIGLFGKDVCNISDQVAQSGFVAGFDVWGQDSADVLRNPRSQFGDHLPAWFVSGDVRSLESVGERAVYLKLGTPPTLESLRQAFLMPDQRIRLPEQLRAKFGRTQGVKFLDSAEPTWPWLTRIAVSGGFHDGLDVELGPGLNAIIGGRGTGKSTTVEITRHACAAPAPKNDDNRKNRKENFSANATATIGIAVADQQRYDIVRSGDDTPPQLRRDGLDLDVDVTLRFGISVYGQRELALLAHDQPALRDFLAISADPDLLEAQAEEARRQQEFDATAHVLDLLESALRKVTEKEEKLKDVRDQLEVAGQAGAVQHVDESKHLTAVQEEVTAVEEWLATLGPLAEQVSKAADRPEVREHACVPNTLTEVSAKAESAIRAAATVIAQAAIFTREALKPALEEHSKRVAVARHQINVALADAGLKDPDELAKLQRSAATLGRAVAQAPEQRKRLAELQVVHAGQVDQLRDARSSISQQLQAAAESLTAAVKGRVRVVVQPQADRTRLLELLASLVTRVNRDQLSKLADAGPAALATALRGDDEQVVKLGASATTAQKLRELSPSQVRKIEGCATPDFIVVEIDLGEAGQARWLDVRDVSPGQKATAMLSLALVTGVNPLIIDQPEDDLDNRYIYDQVVRQIAEVADRRQDIVATHNPNIPILGDAELILALDATADHSRVVACGAIDEPAVADAARQILEGGDRAFRDRARRYRAAAR